MEKNKKTLEITDLKDMLNKTRNMYPQRPAYKIKLDDSTYKIFTHEEVREKIDSLGTYLLSLGLKGKRIAIIGENRYEWEISYLSVACGTGIVVPLDKALPEKELESLLIRSNAEAIFYSQKYENAIDNIKSNTNLKYLFSFDNIEEIILKGNELLKNGNREFLDAQIDSEKMNIMLFTSGTTAASKVVALSHRNITSNLMALDKVLDVSEEDIFLSILPVHHVFECTVGFLFSLYKGSCTTFSDGIRHIVDNFKEYNVSVVACVPAIYEKILKTIKKNLNLKINTDECKALSMAERKEKFQSVHEMLGGNFKLLISGAAALDSKTEESFRLLGLNMVQGYGLTETSPVIAIGSNEFNRIGSVGKVLPGGEIKIDNPNEDGIGELIYKGPNVMLGYFENEEATEEVLKNGWFHTGDLAKIDEDGYVYICGRKKSVIVLKNGKNIFPEEMENIINQIDGVQESFIYGKNKSIDDDNIKINVLIVFNKDNFQNKNIDEIHLYFSEKIKEINKSLPKYKAIRGFDLTEEPLIKTTTNKIKRQENLKVVQGLL